MHNEQMKVFAPLVVFLTSAISCVHAQNAETQLGAQSIQKKLSELEKSADGRLGFFAFDTKSEKEFRFRAEELFPMCSTAKAIIVGAVLKKSMNDKDFLTKRVAYTQSDLETAGYAPATKKNLERGMTISELSLAAMQLSDNAAANLLLKELGGLDSVNQFARSMGNDTFRLDRWEPELNTATPGDKRDTSSPSAMAASIKQLAFGNILASKEKALFVDWLKGNKTGNSRIRAGTPNGWLVGDKTGTCNYGTTNDIGIVWLPDGSPILLAVYFTQFNKDASARDDVIAEATRIVLGEVNTTTYQDEKWK